MQLKYPLLIICLSLFCASAAKAQSVQSLYSELKGKTCKTIEKKEEEAGYILMQCQGVGGYKLQVAAQDDRETIIVIAPDGTKHDLNLMQVGGGGFNYLGERAEWRVKRENGKVVPIALIVRVNVSTVPTDPSKTTSYLTVTKITPQKICMVEALTPRADANQAARAAADASASRSCYQESAGN